jgi:hypothetical protein
MIKLQAFNTFKHCCRHITLNKELNEKVSGNISQL